MGPSFALSDLHGPAFVMGPFFKLCVVPKLRRLALKELDTCLLQCFAH
jgi:hypothetical protein